MTQVELRVSTAEDTITVRDIAIGLLFLAGGQSNMELSLYDAEQGKEIIAAHNDPDLRWYMVPKVSTPEAAEAAEADCHWSCMIPGGSAEMSAIGYFFAARLRRELQIPVGIIGCYWGGTSITAWLDEEELKRSAEGLRYMEVYAKLTQGKTMAQWQLEEDAFEAALNVWNAKVAELRAEKSDISWA